MKRRQFLQRGAMAAVEVSVDPAAMFSSPLEIVQDASFEVPVVYGAKRAFGYVILNGESHNYWATNHD